MHRVRIGAGTVGCKIGVAEVEALITLVWKNSTALVIGYHSNFQSVDFHQCGESCTVGKCDRAGRARRSLRVGPRA